MKHAIEKIEVSTKKKKTGSVEKWAQQINQWVKELHTEDGIFCYF